MEVFKVECSKGGHVIIHCADDGGSEMGRRDRMQREAAGYLAGLFYGGFYVSVVVVLLGPHEQYMLGGGSTCKTVDEVREAAASRLRHVGLAGSRVEMRTDVDGVFTVSVIEMTPEEVAALPKVAGQ
jgi:hypothetical protein